MTKLLKCFTLLLLVFSLISTNVYASASPAKPSTPVLTQDIKTQTEGNVTVTIGNWGNATAKEYRINDRVWQKYVSPIILKENAVVYARGKNASGTFSDVASLKIENIRKLLSKTEISKQSASTVKVLYFDINNNEIGSGSGFIVSSDGQVVTNYHVIDMAPKLEVITSDNTVYEVLGVSAYDVSLDLAVLKLKNAKDLPAVKLGNSDDLKLGEDIVAIGYPLGLQVTVSFGNVSSLNTPGALYRTGRKDVQITAPISEGNSGGPLFNMYGEVVGINYSTIVNAQNMNYSIPVNELKPLLVSSGTKLLNSVIREVYPQMTYSQYENYLYFNYPDCKNDDYIFSFSDINLIIPSKSPEELDVFLSLNNYKYSQILLAEFESNRKLVENWLDEIYKNIKAQFPDKDVYIVLTLDWSFNTRPDGYTDEEVYYNSKTGLWEVYRIKIIYGYNNNQPAVNWY